MKGQTATVEANAKLYLCSATYYAGVARWKLATESNTSAIKLGVSTDQSRIVGEATLSNLYVSFLQGNFKQLQSQIDVALELARSRNDAKLKLATLAVRAFMLVSQGHHSRALKQLNEVDTCKKELSEEVEANATSSLGYIDLLLNLITLATRVMHGARTEKGTDLQDSFQHLLGVLDSSEPTNLFASFAYMALVEGVVALTRSGKTTAYNVDAAIGRLSAYANSFPFATSILHLWQGDLEKLQGRNDFAVSKWTQAAQFAKTVGMLYIEACAQFRMSDLKSTESAIASFGEMGVKYHRFLQHYGAEKSS